MGSTGLLKRESAAALAALGALTACLALAAGLGLPGLLGALFVEAVEGALLWRNLAQNRDSSGKAFRSLGAANLLTLLRGGLIATLAGELLAPGARALDGWLPAVLYTASLLFDYADGWAARAGGHLSRLGEILENDFDGLGVLAASALLAVSGKVPFWIVSAGLLRYLFLAGIWLRGRRGKESRPLEHSSSGKVIAGLMMGYLSAALWPIVAPRFATISGALFLAPFLGGFVRDWLAVTGVLDRTSPGYRRAERLFSLAALEALPLALRAAIVASTALVLPAASPLARWLLGLSALAAACGLFGRLFALALAACALFALPWETAREGAWPLFVSAILMVLCGTGPLSLWKPETLLFARKAA